MKDDGMDVDLNGPEEEVKDVCDELGVVDGVVPLKVLKEYLMETEVKNDEFKRNFVLFILGALLCSTTKPGIYQSYIYAVKRVDGIRGISWAKLTLDFLVEGILKHKRIGQRDTPGCLFLLMVNNIFFLSP